MHKTNWLPNDAIEEKKRKKPRRGFEVSNRKQEMKGVMLET